MKNYELIVLITLVVLVLERNLHVTYSSRVVLKYTITFLHIHHPPIKNIAHSLLTTFRSSSLISGINFELIRKLEAKDSA